MLIKYLRTGKTDNSKGVPFGVVVATGPNKIGWSLCNPKDKFNKKLGIEIAKNRSLLNNYDKIKTCKPLYNEERFKIMFNIINEMIDLSNKYKWR